MAVSRNNRRDYGTGLACVAWRFWFCAQSNNGGRGQRNREEIGTGATICARCARAFTASPLSTDKTDKCRLGLRKNSARDDMIENSFGGLIRHYQWQDKQQKKFETE